MCQPDISAQNMCVLKIGKLGTQRSSQITVVQGEIKSLSAFGDGDCCKIITRLPTPRRRSGNNSASSKGAFASLNESFA
jgi:hypothetical protein